MILLFWYSSNEYIYALVRDFFLVNFCEKDLSANISRSLFIKLSVYFIRFVIIKTFIKKIFVSTLPKGVINLSWMVYTLQQVIVVLRLQRSG